MPVDLIISLSAFAFVASITPGPNNLMLMVSGTNFGIRRTVPHIAGVSLGFTAMLALVGFGLAQLFEDYPLGYKILKAVSAVYLLYLAWKIANAAPPDATAKGEAAGEPLTFLQAAAFQWVNPKAWTMVLTAIGAFTLPTHPITSMAIVTLVFGIINLPCIVTWTVLGTQVRRFLNRPEWLRAFNIGAALLLVATIWPILTSTGLAAH